MLSPSGVASYLTDAMGGYRRAPFTREWVTGNGRTAMAGSLSRAKERSVSAPAQQPQAQGGIQLRYQPLPPLTGVTSESSPAPLPTVTSAPQKQEPSSSVTGASPESSPTPLPAASSVPYQQQPSSAPRETRAQPDFSLPFLPSVEVPVQQQQQQQQRRQQQHRRKRQR